jgi:hypothetical protein
LCGLIAAGTAHGHLMIGGFEDSEASEARGVIAKLLVLLVGDPLHPVRRSLLMGPEVRGKKPVILIKVYALKLTLVTTAGITGEVRI